MSDELLLPRGPVRTAGSAVRGLGRALIKAAVTEARSAGSSKLYWHTQESNSTARRLYDDVASNEGFIVYELDL